MIKMRIVGMNVGKEMFVQKYIRGEWKQEVLSCKAFENMMQNEYPSYWEEYKNSGTDKSAERFFYHYGETEEMVSKGESFVF